MAAILERTALQLASYGHRYLGLKSYIIFLQVLVYPFETSHKVIDISRFSGYNELRCNIALSFGIQGLLRNITGTEWWKITYCRSSGDQELPFGSEPWQ